MIDDTTSNKGLGAAIVEQLRKTIEGLGGNQFPISSSVVGISPSTGVAATETFLFGKSDHQDGLVKVMSSQAIAGLVTQELGAGSSIDEFDPAEARALVQQATTQRWTTAASADEIEVIYAFLVVGCINPEEQSVELRVAMCAYGSDDFPDADLKWHLPDASTAITQALRNELGADRFEELSRQSRHPEVSSLTGGGH